MHLTQDLHRIAVALQSWRVARGWGWCCLPRWRARGEWCAEGISQTFPAHYPPLQTILATLERSMCMYELCEMPLHKVCAWAGTPDLRSHQPWVTKGRPFRGYVCMRKMLHMWGCVTQWPPIPGDSNSGASPASGFSTGIFSSLHGNTRNQTWLWSQKCPITDLQRRLVVVITACSLLILLLRMSATDHMHTLHLQASEAHTASPSNFATSRPTLSRPPSDFIILACFVYLLGLFSYHSSVLIQHFLLFQNKSRLFRCTLNTELIFHLIKTYKKYHFQILVHLIIFLHILFPFLVLSP